LLEVADLSVDYPEFRTDYTLAVPAGDLCVLIGPSGGGKTTLLHVIAGFAQPQSGTLRFAGRDLLPLGPAERPLTIVFQDHNLFPHLTAAQNVGIGVSPSLRLTTAQKAAVSEVLARVGLPGMEARLPSELSGGQRQRLALARALLRERPLILLDEPFSALDPALRKEMIGLVDALRRERGLTVLMSLHTPEDALGVADSMAYVAGGRVVAAGAPETMLDWSAPVQSGPDPR
jgi:thiamine transport system ATP-binding protein